MYRCCVVGQLSLLSWCTDLSRHVETAEHTRGESCISCTELYRQIWKMETPVCKCCCRHPALEIACPACMSLATIIKSDFGWGSRQGHLLCSSASTWGLAQILFPRSWRWHVHGVPSLASARAPLTKHLGHGFSPGFGVQNWVSFPHQSYLDLKM